ncbi:hypothetical protein T05_5095 [Trichinella murrelli]|uniref:Uncharacterized protein n=1 Tax=Trichinella murrelli TaxID=144512 RepID=A0A0V0TM67_9BILA|nr:hypothetical protein T05_5095 [Trichinella murrelli]
MRRQPIYQQLQLRIDNEHNFSILLKLYFPFRSMLCRDDRFDPQQEVPMHKNRFSTLRYANNDHHKGALSSVKLMKQRKSENADDTNQITDGTMQNKRRQEEEPCGGVF